jgi:nucleotide-binding universal stress UspA family protein
MGAIVLGYVDAAGARAALERSIELAKLFGDELVIAFATGPPGSGSVGDEFRAHQNALEEIGQRITSEARERAEQAGVKVTVELPPERPWDALTRVADERDARYIVVGHRGEGPIKGAILGSTPHKLLHLAERPVVVVPG